MEKHLILGAGQIGPFVAERLRARGIDVVTARRSASAGAVSLDVRDADAVARAAEGASVVYHCVNPAYDQWPELLLPMTRGIVEGTARAGARLVALDNLYMYGDTALMHEGAPNSPRSKKGVLRARAADVMLERGAAIGRAADFFGPRASLAAIFGERFFRRVLAGKSAECFGDPDMPHSYSYTPDVAAGLVALGMSDARGVFMLPVQAAETTRQVVDRFARALGRPIAISKIPTWALRALGVFSPVMREVAEMTYQWTQPYVVDDRRSRAELGVAPTDWDTAVAETLRWAVPTYARAA